MAKEEEYLKYVLFTLNANSFTLVYKRLKTDTRQFYFCRLPFAVNAMLKLSNKNM